MKKMSIQEIKDACSNNNKKLVKHLLQTKYIQENINLLHNGYAPFHVACSESNNSIVNELLKNGASPDVKDIYGNLPIHHASTESLYSITNVITLLQIDPNYVHSKGGLDCVPLHLATDCGNINLVNLLLAWESRCICHRHARSDSFTLFCRQR